MSERVTVHVLRHGRCLCLAMHGAPCNWGHGQRWVSYQDRDAPKLATCATCKEALALIPREVIASGR